MPRVGAGEGASHGRDAEWDHDHPIPQPHLSSDSWRLPIRVPQPSQVHARISGLYGIADSSAADGDPVRLGAQLLEGGCRLIQLRCKGWTYDEVVLAGRALQSRCRRVQATFLMNDAPQIAREVEADGVHLGQHDMAHGLARKIVGPDVIIGRSTNDPRQLAEAMEEADYVAFGPIFPTHRLSSPKPQRDLSALSRAVALVARRRPLVAIGGITSARLRNVRETGVDAWAVIGAIAHATDPVAATTDLLGTP